MEWTVVERKGKKPVRPCKQESKEGVHVAQTAVSEVRWPVQRRYRERTLEEKVQDLSSQLRRIRAEVVASEFYKNFLPKLDQAERLWEESHLDSCTEIPARTPQDVSMAHGIAANSLVSYGSGAIDMHTLSAELQASLSVGRSHQASQVVNNDAKGSEQGQLHALEEGSNRLWRWSEVEEMVIYGLGSLEAGHVPRYQLAFALLLADRLPSLQGPLQVFDPVFTEVDVRLLKEQGLSVLAKNEEGRRCASRPTLFYLPHCESDLCSNVVEANLGGGGLAAVLGNSFALYHERWMQSGTAQAQHRRARPEALLGTVESGSVLEVPVSDHHFPVVSAFNDMSLHLFPTAAASGGPPVRAVGVPG